MTYFGAVAPANPPRQLGARQELARSLTRAAAGRMLALLGCASTAGQVNCGVKGEPLFRDLVGALFTEGWIPAGSVLDAGANDGAEACFYAVRAPERTIHAVEPLVSNVEHIHRSVASGVFPRNVQAIRGGLGSTPGWASLGAAVVLDQKNEQLTDGVLKSSSVRPKGTKAFQVYALDQMFGSGGSWHNERLGFAHLDVEGGEAMVLRGARQTIARHQPIFTTEAFPHSLDAAMVEELLTSLETLGYDTWMVQETCGNPVDCRNLINLPRSRGITFPQDSAFARAIRSQMLIPMPNVSAFRQHVFPCCRPGGPCCRHGPGHNTLSADGCCTKKAVAAARLADRNKRREPHSPPVLSARARAHAAAASKRNAAARHGTSSKRVAHAPH